jgi:hypothetical protein
MLVVRQVRNATTNQVIILLMEWRAFNYMQYFEISYLGLLNKICWFFLLKLDKNSAIYEPILIYNFSSWSFIITEKEFVLCNVRTEAKEKVDNRNTEIALSRTSIIIYCKPVAVICRKVKLCYVKRGNNYFKHSHVSLFNGNIQEFQMSGR